MLELDLGSSMPYSWSCEPSSEMLATKEMTTMEARAAADVEKFLYTLLSVQAELHEGLTGFANGDVWKLAEMVKAHNKLTDLIKEMLDHYGYTIE